eukprot:jgi/Botrbrau1/16868/Bobra.150_2s0087.1
MVLAATNRIRAVDPALLRPGRFDGTHLDPDVDLREIARRTELYTGAELEGLCRESIAAALREDSAAERVSARHFEQALLESRPALSPTSLKQYEHWRSPD